MDGLVNQVFFTGRVGVPFFGETKMSVKLPTGKNLVAKEKSPQRTKYYVSHSSKYYPSNWSPFLSKNRSSVVDSVSSLPTHILLWWLSQV